MRRRERVGDRPTGTDRRHRGDEAARGIARRRELRLRRHAVAGHVALAREHDRRPHRRRAGVADLVVEHDRDVVALLGAQERRRVLVGAAAGGVAPHRHLVAVRRRDRAALRGQREDPLRGRAAGAGRDDAVVADEALRPGPACRRCARRWWRARPACRRRRRRARAGSRAGVASERRVRRDVFTASLTVPSRWPRLRAEAAGRVHVHLGGHPAELAGGALVVEVAVVEQVDVGAGCRRSGAVR